MLDEPLYIRAGGSLVAEALIHLRACESLHGGLRLDSDDLVSVGAYVPGSSPRIDEALSKREAVEGFLRQPSDLATPFDDAVNALEKL